MVRKVTSAMQKSYISSCFIIIFVQPLNGFMYSVAPESMCSNSSSKSTTANEMMVFQIPDHLNRTNFTILAEHNCTEGTIRVNITNITSSVNSNF